MDCHQVVGEVQGNTNTLH